MSRRPSTPPSHEQRAPSAYLSALGTSAGFMSVPPPAGTAEGSYEDEDVTEESGRPSGAYSRAEGGGRSTIAAPPTYASNNNNTSAGSRVKGPRPLASSSTSKPPLPVSKLPSAPPTAVSTYSRAPTTAAPSVAIHASPFERPQQPEDIWDGETSTIYPDDSVSQLARRATQPQRLQGPRPLPGPSPIPEVPANAYGWVPPEMLEEDRSTLVPAQRAPSRGLQSQGQYYGEEDEAAYNGTGGAADPNIPLVANAAPPSRVGGNVTPYRGYNAVGADEEEEEEDAYGQWRQKNKDEELGGRGTASSRGMSAEGDGIKLAPTVFTAPLSYIKSLRGASSAGKTSFYDTKQSEYGDNAYPPTISRDYNGGAPTKPIDQDQRVAPMIQRLFYDTTPTEIRIEEHKRGLGVQKRPWACWLLAVVMTSVLIYELVKMARLTGSAIQTHPSFNVMIGPSGSVLINVGARFAGCMKEVPGVSNISWVCLAESNDKVITAADATCSMADICGFGGFPANEPNQSFRFFIPIFLHAGIIHLALNMLAQCVSSAQIERQMGTPRFLLLYFPAGIFGFVLGANFALVGQPSVGASGAIFGTHAAILVDLLAHWNIEYRPVRKLLYLILEIVVGLLLGLVPGIDNFAHLGGFCIGLLAAIVLFPIIHQTNRHRIIFIVLRLIAAPLIVVLFVVLIRNFYNSDPSKACSWCRYLSCWPTNSNNHCKGTGLETISTSSISFTSVFTFLLTFLSLL